MKKKILLSLIFFVSILLLFNVKVNAASVEKTKVNIYALDETDKEYVSIPNNYIQSYTIKVNGTTATPKFTITEGENIIEVDSNGKITPKKSTVTYWQSGESKTYYKYTYGTAKVNVAIGTQNIVVTVNLIDYVYTHCDNVLNAFIKNNINDSMSQYEKLVAITKYTAEEYDYGSSTGYVGMILTGSGSCWGSTSMILKLCDMVGIKAQARNANKDSGAGSGHYNAVALIDGKLYEAEAGYSEPKPRYYYVRERSSEFTLKYNSDKTATVIQYDGFDENIVVPSKIGEYTVTEIGDSAFYRSSVSPKSVTLPETIKTIGYSAFDYCEELESVNIPKSVTEIKGAPFLNCENLKTIKTNGNYVVEDNILYNGNKTKLIQLLPTFNKEKLEMPNTVTEIGDDACNRFMKLKEVVFSTKLQKIGMRAFDTCQQLQGITIPGTCKEIGKGAFQYCIRMASAVLQNGVTTIDDGAFAYTNKFSIRIPKSVTNMGKDVFYTYSGTPETTIYGVKGSTAETYAKNNNLKFIAGEIKTIVENMVTIANENSMEYTGNKVYPKVVVKVGEKILTQNTDYKIKSDPDLINAGQHTVTIIGIGNYDGSVEKKYTVERRDPKIEFTVSDEFVDDGFLPKVTKDPYKTKPYFMYQEVGSYWASNEKPTKEGEYIIYPSSNDYSNNAFWKCEKKTAKLVKRDIPFKDVRLSSWYYNAVKYTEKNNLIKGITDTKFAPNNKLTRGMMVTILYRMEGTPKVTGTPKFKDVQDGSKYYYKAVKWATDNKIVSGYNEGSFGPTDYITRQQLAVILNNYAKYKKKNVSKTSSLSEFKDADKISSYALPAMKWAVGSGVITGNEKTKTINPRWNATRAEVAAMIQKYCKNVGR